MKTSRSRFFAISASQPNSVRLKTLPEGFAGESALSSVDRLGPVTLGDLAAVERVQPPSMTRIVAGLEEAGLVVRKIDERDRRVARVETTVAGQRFLERSRGRKTAYLAARVRTLSAEDRAVLARAAILLEQLLEGEE